MYVDRSVSDTQYCSRKRPTKEEQNKNDENLVNEHDVEENKSQFFFLSLSTCFILFHYFQPHLLSLSIRRFLFPSFAIFSLEIIYEIFLGESIVHSDVHVNQKFV